MFSCHRNSSPDGYTETDTGLLYKLQAIGDGQRKPRLGDYLKLGITYKNDKDSVFLDTYNSSPLGMVILPFNHSSFSGSFEEGLASMNEGDSVSFIVRAEPLFLKYFHRPVPLFLHADSKVKMEVKLYGILDEKGYQEEMQRYGELVDDQDIEEQRRLQAYVDTSREHYSPLANGIYYAPLIPGSGDFPEQGDKIRIAYKGYFLNGRMFESTYDRGQPLEFTFGEQGQVIPGMESAISLLKRGGKAKFIIPSLLAFGEKGSSTGVVPPYTTVIYEIELLNLTK